MNKFKKTLIDLLMKLKLDFRFDEKYRKEIAYLERVLKNDEYIFMPIKKLDEVTYTTERSLFNKNLIKRRIDLTFTTQLEGVEPEEAYKKDFWKQMDEYLFEMLKEYLEEDRFLP